MSDSEIMQDDPRPIYSAWGAGENAQGATVGYEGVTKIEPYQEPGLQGWITWLRVWRGTTVVARLNTLTMERIGYDPPAGCEQWVSKPIPPAGEDPL